MIRRWFDATGIDREDLYDAAREALGEVDHQARRTLDVLRDIFDGRRSIPWREVEEAIESERREAESVGRNAVRRAAETFIDELGLRGWAILSPREARLINKLTERRGPVKMTPRVKTLMEG